MANEKIGLQAVWNNTDFNRGQREYVKKLAEASGATVTTAKNMGDGKGGLTGAAVMVGTALGNLAAKAITATINGLMHMSSAVVENLGNLQKLEIGLTMLEAREMTQAGLALNVSDAMGEAAMRAKSMLEALKDVSLESPFQYQDIARVLQLNMAFGQSSKMAMALTQAMTDMAAISPMASPELLERIAYNFSQMSLTGKITARDVRDLALAGVNLGQILKEELGGSMDTVNKKLKEGKLTMRDVSQAFIDYSERNFAGAARSMATKTIPGLVSSFKDLAVFASKDLFGPAGEVVTQFLEKVYYAAKKLLDSGVLQKIGIWLKVLAETATNFLSKFFNLTDAVGEQAAATSSAVSNAISDAVSDTVDTVTQEAEKAIAVFNTIGLDTAVAWLEGFSSVDYSVLNSIQGYLSTLASNLSSQLGLEGYEAQQLFANLFANITKSLAGGNIAGAFNIIIDKFGAAGEKVVQLAQANMSLAAAEDAVTAAQKKLVAAQKQENASMSNINKLTWEYNEALRKGASPESLKGKLAQINAAYDEHDAAVKAVDDAEDQIDIAKEQRDAAKEQAESMKDLVDVLMRFAQAQQTAADATTAAIADMADEYSQLADITPEDIFAPSIDMQQAEQQLADYETIVREKINEIFGSSLEEALGNLWDIAWGAVNRSFQKYKDETWPKSWEEYWEDVKNKSAIMTTGLGEDFTKAWEGYWDTYKKNAKTAYETVWNYIKIGWNTYWINYKQNAITAYTFVWNKIKEGWEIASNFVKEKIQDVIDKLNDMKDNALQWFIDKITDVRTALWDFRNSLKMIRDWIDHLWGRITGFLNGPLTSLQDTWGWLASLFGGGGVSGATGSSTSSSGVSGRAQGSTSAIPASYTTQSAVTTYASTGGATTVNISVGDINNGMDLNTLVTLIKNVTEKTMVYG